MDRIADAGRASTKGGGSIAVASSSNLFKDWKDTKSRLGSLQVVIWWVGARGELCGCRCSMAGREVPYWKILRGNNDGLPDVAPAGSVRHLIPTSVSTRTTQIAGASAWRWDETGKLFENCMVFWLGAAGDLMVTRLEGDSIMTGTVAHRITTTSQPALAARYKRPGKKVEEIPWVTVAWVGEDNSLSMADVPCLRATAASGANPALVALPGTAHRLTTSSAVHPAIDICIAGGDGDDGVGFVFCGFRWPYQCGYPKLGV